MAYIAVPLGFRRDSLGGWPPDRARGLRRPVDTAKGQFCLLDRLGCAGETAKVSPSNVGVGNVVTTLSHTQPHALNV